MVFHALGQQEGPAIEQYVCARVHVCVCMCCGNEERRGNKDGASHTLSMSEAVVDLQRWSPPKPFLKTPERDSAVRQPRSFFDILKKGSFEVESKQKSVATATGNTLSIQNQNKSRSRSILSVV